MVDRGLAGIGVDVVEDPPVLDPHLVGVGGGVPRT